MNVRRCQGWLAVLALWLVMPVAAVPLSGDYDANGYIDKRDYAVWLPCLSGPNVTPPSCALEADMDGDSDVDLHDFAFLGSTLGHLPIPLRDSAGDMLTSASTEPHSGRQTCAGSCHAHDVDHIANGLHFQQGRTATNGDLAMGDDAFGDGRWWNFSRGRYGRWVAGLDLTGKDNVEECEIGITSFAWIRDCGGCHAGGGPGEFDRDGLRYFDATTGTFGFEALGKTWDDVRLDGDYSVLNMTTGAVERAPWERTGLSEPDCLFCHRRDRAVGANHASLNLAWRQAVLAAGTALVDAAGQPVPAFAAAATGAQGWYSNLTIVGGKATVLEIDYSVGIANGSLTTGGDGKTYLSPSALTRKPTDQVCTPCHGQTVKHSGLWYDERDIHYSKLNRRNDADPDNDIPDDQSTACNFCHPGNVDHNFGKGNFVGHNWRDDLDWANFRSCRECHLEDSPVRHPDAPPVPGTQLIHLAMWEFPDILSCQACHIPYGMVSPYSAVFDSSIASYFSFMPARQFYSADPLNPSSPDKSRWYPALVLKTDSDGKQRLFPGGTIPNVYWADWDQNGTPGDMSDDTIAPVVASQMRLLTSGLPLPGVTDDNGDTRAEVDRPDEILTYIQFLKGGNPQNKVLATRPVLVKGKQFWYENASVPGEVLALAFENTGFAMENWTPFVYSVDHNVLQKEMAWGYDPVGPAGGCQHCHRPSTLDSPVFDRLILADPFGPDGAPVYETVREMTGRNPP